MSDRKLINDETERPLTFNEVVERLPGVNPRRLREELNRIGCYRKIGGKIYLTGSDFEKLLEETKPCRSRSNGSKASPTSMALLPDDAYEKALERATPNSRSTSARKSKGGSSGRRSTGKKAR